MGCTYFAGVLKLADPAPWRRVAQELSLIDAQRGLRVVAARAKRLAGGAYLLPFFVCRDDFDGDERPDRLRIQLERYLDVPLARFEALDPRKASDAVLDYLIEASDTTRSHTIRAGELAPADDPAPHELIGLAEQQHAIEDIGVLVHAYGRDALESCNFAFMGAPGTGKTALARDLVRRFDALGITDGTGNLVKADAAQLIGRYVGHTAPQTKALVERAVGGVLYIDEAYGLIENSFGRECVTTLVDQLDAHRGEVVCVLAGYTAGIDELLASNEGLRERIPYRLEFPGYTDAELAQIFRLFAQTRRFEVKDIADAELEHAMGRLRRQPGFAWARSVRNLFQDTLVTCARRSGEKAATVERVIRPEDLACALNRRLRDVRPAPTVGFCAPEPEPAPAAATSPIAAPAPAAGAPYR